MGMMQFTPVSRTLNDPLDAGNRPCQAAAGPGKT